MVVPAGRRQTWVSRGHRARRLLRDVRGSVAIEFALIGLLCLELILETIQAGFYFYTSAALEAATGKAVRQIMTGSVASNGYNASQFRTNVLCPLLPSSMACTSIITNINTVSEDVSPNGFYTYVNSTQSGLVIPKMDNSKTTYCTGAAGSVVFAQAFYAMPVFSPVWRAVATTWNGSLVRFVQAASAFKNEPFSGAGGTC